MSRAMKCDRCGAFYEPYNTLINPYYVGYNGNRECRTIDLCPTCKDKLNDWMEVKNECETKSQEIEERT